ncbi:MAG: VWA domain-containing protein [Bacteroidales bacterium]|nr:VWA domain-containing protein [Bacteroidales bacterium]MBQ9710891.1 VWA domain-containing protein [Bacteroidales bacterium]MBR1434872.1 VWA domain-containing protein [Bacteroidales bacterium]
MLFAQPQYLVLLLLIPVVFLLYGLKRYRRNVRVRKFGDEALTNALMPSYSRSKGWVRVILFCLAFFFLVVGISRPQIGAKLSEHKARGAEVIVVLDVSNSMLAQDYSPNRLERAKLAISRLSDRLQEDRIGLILFAGTSFVQLPITTDYVSAKMFLGNISTESVPVQGTAIGEAITTAIRSFSAQSEKSRAIVVITDGENHEDDPVEAATQAAQMGIKVYTIGVGSAQGQPIPMNGELLKDRDGNIVVTKLDEKTLQDIAQAGGGAYIHAGNEEFGLNPIIDDIRKMEAEEFNSVQFEEYNEQFMYFLGAALFFLILEMLVGERKSRRHLFTREEN